VTLLTDLTTFCLVYHHHTITAAIAAIRILLFHPLARGLICMVKGCVKDWGKMERMTTAYPDIHYPVVIPSPQRLHPESGQTAVDQSPGHHELYVIDNSILSKTQNFYCALENWYFVPTISNLLALPSTTTTLDMSATSVTIIFSPYHVGLRDHRVGDGPNRIRDMGVVEELEKLGIKVHWQELPHVDDAEGEIGRSFALLAHTSEAVSQAVAKQSFPLILSGNCMASAGTACGLGIEDLGFIYFDAHDDQETPSWNTNGYLDASQLLPLSLYKLERTID
jgi:hypothetical protein